MFFFFNQKTAYDMRISDWISDVCSSDLQGGWLVRCSPTCSCFAPNAMSGLRQRWPTTPDRRDRHSLSIKGRTATVGMRFTYARLGGNRFPGIQRDRLAAVKLERPVHSFCRDDERSEEHTSELQSLMRISYAVFCLKKKN